MTDSKDDPYLAAYIRERQARESAERLLNEKTREIYRNMQIIESQYDQLQQTYQELTQTQNQLIESEKLATLGRLAAGIAHEINNPIGFVQSNLQTLGEYFSQLYEWIPPSAESLEFQDDATSILRESAAGIIRIKNITEALLAYSKESADSQTIKKEVTIDHLLERALKKSNAIHNPRISINPPKNTLKIIINPRAVAHSLAHLIINALQATEGKNSPIQIQVENQGKFVALHVIDDGPGIAPETLGKVFDPFFTTKAVGAGAGLGLSTARELMRSVEGDIQVQSDIGCGAKFSLIFPKKPNENNVSA